MTGLVSVYLDIFRILAAIGVFLSHAVRHSGSPGVLPNIYFDHKLVIVFFVISGYVIAASASRPGRTLANYSFDRLARLSSVVIPALALTYGLDAIGSMVSPEMYSFVDAQRQPVRFIANFFYCQQIWNLCANPSTNGPFWSLGYEFWFYALFGIWFFVRPKWSKTLWLLAVSLLIGPKILLLFPAWAVGATAFYASKAYQPSYKTSFALFAATGIATVLALVFGEQLGLSNGKAGIAPLYYSSNFLGDNIFAVVVASHFLCCGLLSRHFTNNLNPYGTVKVIRWLASHTFSLYVYHMPTLLFIRAITKYDPSSLTAVLEAMSAALLFILALSKITEEQYPALKDLLRRWLKTFVGGSPLTSRPAGLLVKQFKSPAGNACRIKLGKPITVRMPPRSLFRDIGHGRSIL